MRTGFIVNFISFALLLLCLGLFLQSEYRIWSMRATVEELEQRIRLSEADDQRSLELSARFRELAAHAIELQHFTVHRCRRMSCWPSWQCSSRKTWCFRVCCLQKKWLRRRKRRRKCAIGFKFLAMFRS